MYKNLDNINLIVQLLKENNINQIVISPGGTNIPLIKLVENDSFFTCYSIVDERSAVYFAIGIYLQTKSPVVTLCTSAQATRNYIPGLTEAFYKRVPILAITMEKHPRFKYQEYMQAPDQASLPRDAVKQSFELPFISDINDYYHSNRVINEAILELSRDGLGPVQLCVPWLDFPLNNVKPDVKKISCYTSGMEFNFDIDNKKVLIVIGENSNLDSKDIKAINDFCENTNTIVYINHLSNFNNDYTINANLLLSSINSDEFLQLKPDILISIGGQTGDYPFYLKFAANNAYGVEHWRICDDGKVVDTYDKLTKIFQCAPAKFFTSVYGKNENHSFYKLWRKKNETLISDLNLPFSNVAIAQYLHNKIPKNSIIQFSILNSLRCWNLFELDPSIECFSNVGAFGIDGGMSTLIGQSVVSEKKSFMIIGDLAFFYDMNSLGIRHIKNNLRILLINNNGGVEFKLHRGNKKDIDRFIAAANHYQNGEGWAKTCGFEYISALNIEQFKNKYEKFIGDSEKPILFEVFIKDVDESDAYNSLIEANKTKNTTERIKYNLKQSVKGFLGEEKYKELKSIIKK